MISARRNEERIYPAHWTERAKDHDRRIRNWLPYGMWTCADGRQVLFNRSYVPIWQRRLGEGPTRADACEWVPWKTQHHLFDDGSSPWHTGQSKTRRFLDRVLSNFLCGEPLHPEQWDGVGGGTP